MEEGFGGFLSSPLEVVAHTVWRTRQGGCVEGDTGNKRCGGHCRKDIRAIQGVDAIAGRIFGSKFQVLHVLWYSFYRGYGFCMEEGSRSVLKKEEGYRISCGGRSRSVLEKELCVRASLHPIPLCKFFGKAYCHVSAGILWNSWVKFSSFSGSFLSQAQCHGKLSQQ